MARSKTLTMGMTYDKDEEKIKDVGHVRDGNNNNSKDNNHDNDKKDTKPAAMTMTITIAMTDDNDHWS